MPTRRVGDLQHGQETVEYGVVTNREGRKVWFGTRVVIFTSEEEELEVVPLPDEA